MLNISAVEISQQTAWDEAMLPEVCSGHVRANNFLACQSNDGMNFL
jgi:hypothetical protein